jgi:hypothetical protein
MKRPEFPTCPFLGPGEDGVLPNVLPADYESDPLKYLPPRIVLSAEESDLAERYERGDTSRGHFTSLYAHIRRGGSPAGHQERREKFRAIKAEVEARGLVLPPAFVQLVESDDFVSRLRHEFIFISLPDVLVPLPAHPDHVLFLMGEEGYGCGYWLLLLAPDGGHEVIFSDQIIGRVDLWPGYKPQDVAKCKLFRCAENFNQWIVNFCLECVAQDRKQEEFLRKYPGQ